jgi:hypothetical protein
LSSHGEHFLMVFARLKDGVTLARANSDLRHSRIKRASFIPMSAPCVGFSENSCKKPTRGIRAVGCYC